MIRNIAASVRARLLNRAKSTQRPFQEILQYYALERFLYRLSQTQHSHCFVLKGALMLRVWGGPGNRPTRDIDFLGYLDNEVSVIERIVKNVCLARVGDDGLRFDEQTVTGTRIKEDADYEGVRIKFVGFLERARIPMQLDVGFGDVVHPEVEEQIYPTILDSPAPRLRMYPKETMVAEKFEAMIYLGTLNSRMKDFFDIWLLSKKLEFIGEDLASALHKTFENRGTELDPEPVALTTSFTQSERSQKQWAAFIRRSNLKDAPATLEELRHPLCQFLLPVVEALIDDRVFTEHWSPPGPWTSSST